MSDLTDANHRPPAVGVGRRRGAVLLALGVLVGAGTGCGSGTHSAATPRPTGSTAPATTRHSAISIGPIPPATSAAIGLPLDAYRTTSNQNFKVLSEANEMLTARCMAAHGYVYAPGDPGSGSSTPGGGAPSTAPAAQSADLYGITDPSQARSFGYGRPATGALSNMASGTAPRGVPTISQLVSAHGTGYVMALFGFIPPGTGSGQPSGCINASESVVYAPAYGSTDRNLVGELGAQADQETESDRRVLDVERAWSACMAASGFSFDTPMAAAQRQWPTPPSPQEIATAVADVSCKQGTNLVNTWRIVEAAFQTQLIERNAASLEQLQKDFDHALALAQAVVTGAVG